MIAASVLSPAAQQDMQAGVSMEGQAGIVEAATLEMIQGLILDVAVAIAQDWGGSTYNEAVTFGVGVAQAQSAILTAAANLGLDAGAVNQFAGSIIAAALMSLPVGALQSGSAGYIYESALTLLVDISIATGSELTPGTTMPKGWNRFVRGDDIGGDRDNPLASRPDRPITGPHTKPLKKKR
jgi:hypothetical protein